MKKSRTEKSKHQGSGVLVASPFLLPSLIGLMVFSLIPLIISGFISLTNWNGLDQLMQPGFFQDHFIGLDNYKTILTTPEFWRTLGNTAEYIVLYIPLMLAASLLVASLLSRPRKAIGMFRIVYYIPVLTSWVAASLIWKSVLAPQYGALNGILEIFGIEGPGWLLDENWAMPAIVLVSVWKDMGFFGLILLSGIIGINRTYYEAADIDGANGWTKFTRITLPLLTPSIFYVVIVAMINSFQLFPQIMIMTDGGPGGATTVFLERIYKYAFVQYKMGMASTYACILFVVLLVFTAVQFWMQKRWVNYDA